MNPQHPAPRIAPLAPPYTPSVDAALGRWMPPESGVEPLRLFRTLLVHERLASLMRPLGAGILGAGAAVEPLLREVMIHRTCALTGAAYEWGVHVAAFARPLGLSELQIDSTVKGSSADACWDARQAAVMLLAEQLHETSTISASLWSVLVEHFGEREIVELIVTAGWYHAIAYLCNGLRIEPEPWAERFPDTSTATSST